MPKNLALEKADRVATLAAPILLVFYKLSQPFVIVIESSSSLILKWLGLGGKGHAHGGHSAEELKFIVQSSRHEGHLQQFQEDAIENLIELSDYIAREIMTPRNNIISLPVEADLDVVLNCVMEHKYSRIPIYEGGPEHIIGVVHYKDLMRVWDERRFAHDRHRVTRPFPSAAFCEKTAGCAGNQNRLNQLIDEFQK